MALVSRNRLGAGGMLGALVALGGVAGCGDDFSGDDCRVSHTCAAVGGDASNQAGDTGDAGNDSTGQGGSSNGPGSGGAGAGNIPEAGAGPGAECMGPEDCDNDDPADGEEICGEDGLCAPGNAPPTVVSVSPEGDETDVETDTSIVITFSEALDPATVTAGNIRIIDGDTIIEGEVSYADSEVTFTPANPLALLAGYEVSVTTGVTDAEGAALLEAFSSTFQTRDGAWHTVNAASGSLFELADTLPITANGDVLVSWIAINAPGYYCPTSARWFNKGDAQGATKTFTGLTIQDCRSVAAGSNADGVAAVVWQEDVEYGEQFRAGAWSSDKATLSSFGSSWRYAVGVTPNGSVSFFQQGAGSGTFARRTSDTGTWLEAAANIAVGHRGLSPAKIAFDADNNGFAVWRADVVGGGDAGKDEILVARYTAGGGWQNAEVLPGSLAAANDLVNERGVPAIAVDDDGGAVVVWLRESTSESVLVASHYTSANGWANPVKLSGSIPDPISTEAPGLVFDGTTYVAAWTAEDDGLSYTYSIRYDAEFSEWGSYEPRTDAATLARMPQLAVDSHQNLLMTWLEPTATGGRLVYARYDARASAWSEARDVSGGAVKHGTVPTTPTPLGVAENGLGALMWGDQTSNALSTIRLASFD